ncbi:MAG: hypothetical protein AB1Z98_13010 [Nannocystaceae bacterium]
MVSPSHARRVAYFTAGTVGAGHVVRGEAVRRGLRRAGFDGAFRAFVPPSPFALGPADEREEVIVKGDPRLADPAHAARSALGQRLQGFAPDLLVVDMFWAPVRHLLAHLRCPAWLLVRACPPVWLQGQGEVRFDAGAWDRIIEIEPLGLPAATHALDPLVVVDPDELEPASALRERVGAPADRPLTVISHAGKPGELQTLRRVAARGTDASASPLPFTVELDLHRDGLFPAARWLAGADRIVAGAGYNTFWEAQWLGWVDRSTFVPFERGIDRQRLRMEILGATRPRENGANTLASWIMGER